MTNIYDEFDAVTRGLDAYAITDGAQQVGRVVIKHGGRLRFSLQVWGLPMVKGSAGGGGNDRALEAASVAATRLIEVFHSADVTESPEAVLDRMARVVDALTPDGGKRWDDRLRAAGFTVQHVLG